jgi:hypothetical protein
MEEPTGFYLLDLTKPYDYTIACELLQLAQNQHGYGVYNNSLSYLPEGGGVPEEGDLSENFPGVAPPAVEKPKPKNKNWQAIKMVKKEEKLSDFDANEFKKEEKRSRERVRNARYS